MRKDLIAFIAILATLPASASAYLSQDGTRLANGSGKCAVCATGWIQQPDGKYTCASTPTTDQPDCRPAAALLVPHGTRVPVYNIDGDRLDAAVSMPKRK